MLAEDLGYVGFASDIYGADLHVVDDQEQRIALAGMYRSNATLFAERIRAAVDLVKTFDEVDPEKVAIIGYWYVRESQKRRIRVANFCCCCFAAVRF